MFDLDFFREHQNPLLDVLNSSLGGAVRRSLWIPDRRHRIVMLTPNAAHVLLPDGQYRAILYSNPQYGQALWRNYKPLWEALHWWDMRWANRFMPAWNAGFDTYSSQPDGTAGLDTTISSSAPTTNYGTSTGTYVGESGGNIDRTLIKFNFSSITPPVSVSVATLSLWLYDDLSSNARSFRVYRQKRDWVESEATWNIWKTSNNWSTAGGFHTDDCEQTDIGSRSMSSSESAGEKQWTLTNAALAEMINGTFTNKGFLMKADTESADSYGFRTSDYGTAGERPKLVMTYSLVGGDFFPFF